MIASLMMYLRPELVHAHDRYWTLIRQELGARGIDAPREMANDADTFGVWQHPQLVFSQTCGMPYRTKLQDTVTLIGTPDFGLEGCAPGYYRSAVVVRADDARDGIAAFKEARFVYNQTGYAAAYAHLAEYGFWFHNRVQSNEHRVSAQMIAAGTADIAMLDAVTWRLIERHDEYAQKLRVLEWTLPTPGLPYIAAKGVDRAAMFEAVAAAIDALSSEDRAALGLQGLINIPKAAYMAVKNPPADVM